MELKRCSWSHFEATFETKKMRSIATFLHHFYGYGKQYQGILIILDNALKEKSFPDHEITYSLFGPLVLLKFSSRLPVQGCFIWYVQGNSRISSPLPSYGSLSWKWLVIFLFSFCGFSYENIFLRCLKWWEMFCIKKSFCINSSCRRSVAFREKLVSLLQKRFSARRQSPLVKECHPVSRAWSWSSRIARTGIQPQPMIQFSCKGDPLDDAL